MRRFLPGCALAALVLVAACDSPTDAAVATYTLTSINGASLPAPAPGRPGLEVVAGGFEMRRMGDMMEWVQVRCAPVQPAGATCAVSGDGITRRNAIHNALENRMYLDDGTWFPMTIDASTALIQYGSSPEHHFRYNKTGSR